jgi:hypothetical protein
VTSDPFITRRFYSDAKLVDSVLNLSMALTPESFIYAIFDPSYSQVVELCEVKMTEVAITSYSINDLASMLIRDHQLDQRKFLKVQVMLLNQDFTLAPKEFTDNNSAKELLGFSGIATASRALQHQLAGITFNFAVDAELLSLIERKFPQAGIRHCGAICASLLSSHESLSDCNLFLNLWDSMLELTGRQGSSLLFYNCFQISSDEDALYYILFAMEQFSMDPLKTNLVVAGQKASNDSLIKNISKYIRSVKFAVTAGSTRFSGQLESLPRHFYFTLLNQHLCEL